MNIPNIIKEKSFIDHMTDLTNIIDTITEFENEKDAYPFKLQFYSGMVGLMNGAQMRKKHDLILFLSELQIDRGIIIDIMDQVYSDNSPKKINEHIMDYYNRGFNLHVNKEKENNLLSKMLKLHLKIACTDYKKRETEKIKKAIQLVYIEPEKIPILK